MKKVAVQLLILAVTVISLQAQKASNCVYHLTNGINVKTEKCWNNVWIYQKFEPVKAGDQSPLLSLNLRTLGELSAGSTFQLYSGGKEVKVQSAKPGNYSMKITYKLSGEPGTLTFDISDVVIKPSNRTVLSVTLYEYQVLIDESPGSFKGLAGYETVINRFKGNTDQKFNEGTAEFYAKGSHDKTIPPDVKTDAGKGNIKAGTYDMLVSVNVAGRIQKVWLENFTLKPDVGYKISINLNAGVITYAGLNKDVVAMHLYPAGTAARQSGNPAPDKTSEIIKLDNPSNTFACAPGAYDVLLNFKNGAKYEWRKNIVVTTGARALVK